MLWPILKVVNRTFDIDHFLMTLRGERVGMFVYQINPKGVDLTLL